MIHRPLIELILKIGRIFYEKKVNESLQNTIKMLLKFGD